MALFLWLWMDEREIEVNGVKYTPQTGLCLFVTGYGDSDHELAFRKYICINGEKFTVKEIHNFAKWSGVKISIPNSVERLGNECFMDCQFLSDVFFEYQSNLKEIGNWTFCFNRFNRSNLITIQIPNSVEKLGHRVFSLRKNLCEVTFESQSQLRELGNWIFVGSSVKSIELPPKCEILTGLSLLELESIRVTEDAAILTVKNNFVINTKSNALIRYLGHSAHIIIESFIESIAEGCFGDCRAVRKVTFESGSKLREIGNEVFCWAGLESILIPNSVERIGHGCFCLCKSISEVLFDSGSKVNEILGCCFSFSGLKSILIPNTIERIGEKGFFQCESLYEVTFESLSKLREIGNEAFASTDLKCIMIPKSVEKIGNECFCLCKSLGEVMFELGSVLKEIGTEAFSRCSLKCVRVGDGFDVKYNWPNECRIESVPN
jgi:hypothetical protein